MGADRISFAGPGKRDDEIEAALKADATINLESEGEAARALAIADRMGVRPRLAVRVNPTSSSAARACVWAAAQSRSVSTRTARAHWRGASSPQARTGGAGTSSPGRRPSMPKRSWMRRSRRSFWPRGYPMRSGCLRRWSISAAASACRISPARRSWTSAASALRSALHCMPAARCCPAASLHWSWAAGSSLRPACTSTRIVDVKRSQGERFAVVDGGLHHQLAASGNFGAVIRRNYPLAIAEPFRCPGRRESDHARRLSLHAARPAG